MRTHDLKTDLDINLRADFERRFGNTRLQIAREVSGLLDHGDGESIFLFGKERVNGDAPTVKHTWFDTTKMEEVK